MAAAHLQRQFRDLTQHPLGGFRVELSGSNLFDWTVWFLGPRDTPYEGGCYKARLRFPQDFPFKPPTLTILSTFWHPNVYADGDVCISILHPPGTDEQNSLETAQMRWTPIQSIEKVLVSFLSLISDPDAKDSGAPANVDALVEYRNNREAYNKRCKENMEASLKALPVNFQFPHEEDAPMKRYGTYESDEGGSYDTSTTAAANLDEPYAEEIAEIKDMGLGIDKTDVELIEICKKCKGDMERILEELC